MYSHTLRATGCALPMTGGTGFACALLGCAKGLLVALTFPLGGCPRLGVSVAAHAVLPGRSGCHRLGVRLGWGGLVGACARTGVSWLRWLVRVTRLVPLVACVARLVARRVRSTWRGSRVAVVRVCAGCSVAACARVSWLSGLIVAVGWVCRLRGGRRGRWRWLGVGRCHRSYWLCW